MSKVGRIRDAQAVFCVNPHLGIAIWCVIVHDDINLREFSEKTNKTKQNLRELEQKKLRFTHLKLWVYFVEVVWPSINTILEDAFQICLMSICMLQREQGGFVGNCRRKEICQHLGIASVLPVQQQSGTHRSLPTWPGIYLSGSSEPAQQIGGNSVRCRLESCNFFCGCFFFLEIVSHSSGWPLT